MRILAQEVERSERARRVYEVEGMPPLVEYTRHYGTGNVDVLLHVERVELAWKNGEFKSATVSGHRLNSKGKPSKVEGSRRYPAEWFDGEKGLATPPEWLIGMVRVAFEPSMLEYETQQDQRRRAGGEDG